MSESLMKLREATAHAIFTVARCGDLPLDELAKLHNAQRAVEQEMAELEAANARMLHELTHFNPELR